MSYNLSKQSILKKTAQISTFTFLSRLLGVIREMLLVRYFGIGVLSDAFITAFRIPNFFRHIFAEGALSASFVPTIVAALKNNDRESAQGLMTLSFIFFEGVVLALYCIVFAFTWYIVRLIAPGFSETQIAHTIPFLRIMFPLLMLVSSSALFAGALQAVNHFFAPASSPAILNIVFVATIYIALMLNLPPAFVACGVLFGGIATFLVHAFCFMKEGFVLGEITQGSKDLFRQVMSSFLPCLLGVSVVELNLFVSGMIASYLPPGSISLLYYGSRFLNIPVGIFAVAFSNTMLPHFSRIVLYARSRFNFYLLEVTMFVTWVIIPVAFFLMFVAQNFFVVFLATKKVSPEKVMVVTSLFNIYMIGLLFICINKLLLSMLYSLKDTRSATIAAGISAGCNMTGDIIALYFFGAYGFAAANGVAAIILTGICLLFLAKKHDIVLDVKRYFSFLIRYIIQLALAACIFYAGYYTITGYMVPDNWRVFCTDGFGFWPVSLSCGLVSFFFLWVTRELFGIQLYFLGK